MFSVTFPQYHKSDGLNSLATKCVHVLCSPVDALYKNKTNQTLSTLYDLNTVNRTTYDSNNSEAPCRLIEKLYEHCGWKRSPSLLDINSRQSIINYIIRERIFVRANLIEQIILDGGVYYFDLWQLSEINKFNDAELERILRLMLIFANCFRKLSIGGNGWIYNSNLWQGVLRQFLCVCDKFNLRDLKIQQIPPEIDFIQLLSTCPNLASLEIVEYSLRNQDIFNIDQYLESNPELPVCQSLKYVSFPSSVEQDGLLHFLARFPRLTRLRCTPFEPLLDTLHEWLESSNKKHSAEKAHEVLQTIQGLSIAHPMSYSMVSQLVSHCPRIEELSLVLQKNMNLSTLATGLRHLKKLELHNSCNESLKFHEHVVPILNGCGRQIKFLSLINFDHIDLTKLAQYCPNLHTLSAQCFFTIQFQSRVCRLLKIKRPFRKLKNLRLRPRPDRPLPVEICEFLLSNATKLGHIELYCCSELTDQTIDQIKQNNMLARLQTFILRHGHNVTNQALFRLVSCSTCNNNLVFHDCGLVPPDIKS